MDSFELEHFLDRVDTVSLRAACGHSRGPDL